MIKSTVETILLNIADGNVHEMSTTTMENSLASYPKMNIRTCYTPGIPEEKPLLCTTGGMYKNVHNSTIPSNKCLEQPKWPLSEEKINELYNIHTMDCYMDIKINKVQ